MVRISSQWVYYAYIYVDIPLHSSEVNNYTSQIGKYVLLPYLSTQRRYILFHSPAEGLFGPHRACREPSTGVARLFLYVHVIEWANALVPPTPFQGRPPPCQCQCHGWEGCSPAARWEAERCWQWPGDPGSFASMVRWSGCHSQFGGSIYIRSWGVSCAQLPGVLNCCVVLAVMWAHCGDACHALGKTMPDETLARSRQKGKEKKEMK